MRKDDAFLLDILIAARKIERFTEGLSYGQFCDNEMAQSADGNFKLSARQPGW